MDFRMSIASEIASALEKAFNDTSLTPESIAQMMEVPPDTAMGDYAFPCFRLAKVLRKAPPMIADALKAAIDAPFLKEVQSVKGYLNFFINRATYAAEILRAVREQGENYGGGNEGEGKTICLDYSSINIAKRFHIGHLSTTMIGNALYRMYSFLGYKCVGINHLGDYGTQFGKMIAAYKLWGKKEEIEQGGVDAMVSLYVKFDQEAQKDESLNDLGRAWFKKIEDGDEEALEIFNWFKSVTLKDAERVYNMLGVKFDSYAGESFYIDKMAPVLDELREKNLLVESDGAQMVDLKDYNMPPCLLLRSDGASLYHTRDLAAAFYRKNTYDFEKCLYVVAYQQDLHFKQLFKVIELMGHDWVKGMEHVSFGMISYEGQALSTRKGHVVYLDDLLTRAVEKARAIMDEKSPDLEDKDAAAKVVGIGSVIFFVLYNNRIKDIDFSWDRALNFDGETGPYVQYTHARSCSVLRKAGECDAQPDYEALSGVDAQNVIRILEQFPATVREAVDRNEPSMVTRYSVGLAQAFNKFYYESRILDDDMAARAAKLELTRAARQTIATALNLIGVEAPERM
ncbi:MAG: arginine--tRNA ligase [Clostridia bacterium]|nr:arginine--tRNA ligase [Clostridia bacterium]